MKTLKQLKPLLSFVRKNKHRPVMQSLLVTDESLIVSDFDTVVAIKNVYNLSKGLHDTNTFDLIDNPVKDISDYPLTNRQMIVNEEFNINTKDFKDILQYVSKDETRRHLNCVAISDNNLVATDGHKLKKYKLSNINKETYLIPRESIQVALKFLKAYKIDSFVLSVNESHARLGNEHFTIDIKLLQRDYPKWQVVIPNRWDKEFTITNWINFKEIKLLFNPISYGVKLTGRDNKVFLTINNSKIESPEFEIGTCDNNFEFGINASYVDIAMNGNKACIVKYNKELAPMLFNEAIVMPLKL